jgi:hypothetical protein
MSRSAFGLLDALRELGVEVIISGENLRVRPASKIPDGLDCEIRRLKPELLAILDLSGTNPEIFGGVSGR